MDRAAVKPLALEFDILRLDRNTGTVAAIVIEIAGRVGDNRGQ
jgi:hypothetical protein